jgi:triosephosphate isomerase
MRIPFLAGNWKMYKTTGEAVRFAQDLSYMLEDFDKEADIVVCPPFTALKSLSTFIEYEKPPFQLGAQNVHWEEEGAFTGEISPLMLKELEVKYVIIGHSERRHVFGETNEMIEKKVKSALKHGLHPILCVGETLEEREKGKTSQVIQEQLLSAVENLSADDVLKMVFAYEPVWAIGTGKSAFPEQANDASRRLRALIGSRFNPEVAKKIRILYGGSVKPENVAEFMAEPDIDGVLVGGASLDPVKFVKIVEIGASRS